MPSGRTADMKTAKICADGRSHRWEMTVELHQAYTSPEPREKGAGSMQKTYTMPKPYREPFWTYERIESIREWSRKPMSPAANFAVAAIVGMATIISFYLAATI